MKYYISIIFAILLVACNNEWNNHYSPIDGEQDWGNLPNESASLYDVLMQQEEQYSYILSLFDKEIGDNKKESSWLNTYFEKYPQYTFMLFTDKQFDDKLSNISSVLSEGVNKNEQLKTALIKSVVLRNILIGQQEVTAGNEYRSFDKTFVKMASEPKEFVTLKNGNVYLPDESIVWFPMDFFTIRIEPETWKDYTMGGGSSKTTFMLPKAFGGNGLGTCFKDEGKHLFMKIRGIINNKSYILVDGITYKIKVLMGLYKSMRAAFWAHGNPAMGAKDQKLYMENSPYFNEEHDFYNSDLNAGMQLFEFEAPLFNKDGYVKFHIDFRNRKAPDVNGMAPTADQRGVIIDYIEFEPMFN